MTEQKVKKRGWVKNAAIIFLSVMLVLTFFSNTIMNYSLPEAAAQYVQSGAINAKIRGTGTVTAMESYEVKSEQVREVLSVPVQVGDTVKVGDTLLLFSDAESTQVKDAEAKLDALVLEYQKGLLNANSVDYAKENRDIKLAQEALDKAKSERNENTYVASSVESAKKAASNAKDNEDVRQGEVDVAQANLDALGALTHGTSGDYSSVTAANDALNEANGKLKTAIEKYNALEATAKAADRGGLSVAEYMAVLAKNYAAYKDSTNSGEMEKYAQSVAFNTKDVTQIAADKALQTYNAAYSNYLNSSTSGNEYEWNKLNKILVEAKSKLKAATKAVTIADNNLKEMQAKKTAWETADKAVIEKQVALENNMFALAEKQKTDGKTAASTSLDLGAKRKQINDLKDDLAKLQKGGEGASVLSKVNGKISTISVSAGKMTVADTALMIIEVPDMGYGVSFSVTTEQSKKIKVGDAAEITNYNSSEPLTATLVGIKSDPKNPGTNKILNFKLQGEVESGTPLALSIGERGGSYDTLVPNSAIRSDNNGKFVLVVIAKNSPFGNRYIAQRIDVKAILSDDVNTAVSGALTTSDRVITTSTKPVEPGKQVRLPD